MKVKIDNGRICIPIMQLIEMLTPEEKQAIIDTLSCEDDIIRNVAAQLLEGWTELGSHGARGALPTPDSPFHALDSARREIALRSSEVSKEEIEALCSALRWAKANEDKYSQWGWAMYHGGPKLMPPCLTYDDTLKYEVIKKGEKE